MVGIMVAKVVGVNTVVNHSTVDKAVNMDSLAIITDTIQGEAVNTAVAHHQINHYKVMGTGDKVGGRVGKTTKRIAI